MDDGTGFRCESVRDGDEGRVYSQALRVFRAFWCSLLFNPPLALTKRLPFFPAFSDSLSLLWTACLRVRAERVLTPRAHPIARLAAPGHSSPPAAHPLKLFQAVSPDASAPARGRPRGGLPLPRAEPAPDAVRVAIHPRPDRALRELLCSCLPLERLELNHVWVAAAIQPRRRAGQLLPLGARNGRTHVWRVRRRV